MNDNIVISSGHGKYIRGASGYLDEVNEARRVVDRVAELLRASGVTVKTFHDDVSHSQTENLNRIVNFHNSQTAHDLDVSVHFNDYQTTSVPMGTECLYISQALLATAVVMNVSAAGHFINRGPKSRPNLYFLKNTNRPAILIEVCFVDSKADSDLYNKNFDAICAAIARSISGKSISPPVDQPPVDQPPVDQPPAPVVDPPVASHTVLRVGDTGPFVKSLQTSLGIIPVDGSFGRVTEGGVKGFQAAVGLAADGVVSEKTWTAVDELDRAKHAGNSGLAQAQINSIIEIADASEISSHDWGGRGTAPTGYTAGVALCFALAATWLAENDPVAMTMAQAARNNSEDALTWYHQEFAHLGMDNSKDGIDTLRHLFALMLGLGLRESSGKYCEGRDLSADNVSADTAEAGMFQTSWNIRSVSPRIPPLLPKYWANPNGFLTTFQRDSHPDSNDLGNFGSGDGAKYQFLSKFAPAFHAFVTAIGMRYLGGPEGHWGPLRRKEAELRPEADKMLLSVQHHLADVA
jgi:hypothetical protein